MAKSKGYVAETLVWVIQMYALGSASIFRIVFELCFPKYRDTILSFAFFSYMECFNQKKSKMMSFWCLCVFFCVFLCLFCVFLCLFCVFFVSFCVFFVSFLCLLMSFCVFCVFFVSFFVFFCVFLCLFCVFLCLVCVFLCLFCVFFCVFWCLFVSFWRVLVEILLKFSGNLVEVWLNLVSFLCLLVKIGDILSFFSFCFFFWVKFGEIL